jgi:hypothetical protein
MGSAVDARLCTSVRATQDNEPMWAEPAGAVYGTISVGVLLAAESALKETYPATVASVVITLVMYVLAHAYAGYTGERLEDGEPLSLREFGVTLTHESWLLVGAGIPLIAVLIAWAVGASLETAVSAAVWTSAAMVVAIELAAGIRAGETGRNLAVQTALGAVLGALVIVLRLVLH